MMSQQPLWENLKAIVRVGANTSKNLTNDAQKKQAIDVGLSSFLNQPTPKDQEEMLKRNGEAIAMQGQWNSLIQPGGVVQPPHGFNFGAGGGIPGTTKAVYSDGSEGP